MQDVLVVGESGVRPVSQELSTQEIKNLIQQIRMFGSNLCISGGEPLTRKSLVEVLTYAKKSNLKCEILTNGTLITPEIARELVSVSDSLILAIDGPVRIHDLIRGEGKFDMAVQGMNLVNEAEEVARRKLSLRINLTISSINTAYLDEVIDIAHNLDCSLSFQHLIFSDHKTAHQQKLFLRSNLGIETNTADGFVTDLHKFDVTILIEKLHSSQDKAKRLKVPFQISPFLKNEEEIRAWYTTVNCISGMHCTYPWTTMYIKPDGEVQPCEFINYSLGNVRMQDVSDVWNGHRARQFRRTLKKGLFPGCLRCCELTPKPLL